MKTSKSCDLWAEKLAMPEELPLTEREAFDAHIASCPDCAFLFHEYQLLTTHIQALPKVKSLTQTTSEFLWQRRQLQYSKKQAPARQKILANFRFVRKIEVRVISLVAICMLIVFFIWLQASHYSLPISNGSTNPNTTISGSKSFNPPCQLLVRESQSCFQNYKGAVYNTTSHLTSTMLCFIQQNQNTLIGSCMLYSPLVGDGPLVGTVTGDGHIDFTVHNGQNAITIHFIGEVNANSSIDGTYTSSDKQTGTWSMHPSL